jgi:hypothetical protein
MNEGGTMAGPGTPIDEARELFGESMLGPEEVARLLTVDAARLAAAAPALLATVPYERDALRAARDRGELLVFRVPADGEGPLTVLRLIERFPGAIHPKLMKGVGYQLKDEWTLDQEPFAQSATCRLEWRLVHREPVEATRNLSYGLQEEALARYAASIGLAGTLRRRSGIEIVYDTLVFARARGTRLLARTWDWSDTPTLDGGFITAGEFTSDGLHVLGYSRAVRFGTLGVCPQH